MGISRHARRSLFLRQMQGRRDISSMRYKIQILDALGGWIVVITDYTVLSKYGAPQVHNYSMGPAEIKVADLQHILGDLYRQVSESTP